MNLKTLESKPAFKIFLFRWMKSISFQVTAFSFSGTFLVLIATWFVLYGLLTKTLAVQDWGLMEERVRTIASLLKADQSAPEFLKTRVEKEWARREYDRFFVRILRADGEMVTETPMDPDHDQEHVLALLNDPANLSKRVRPVSPDIHVSEPVEKFIGDEFYRLSTATVVVRGNTGAKKYRIDLAMDRTSEATLFAAYRATLFFVIVVGFLLSSLIAWMTLRYAVGPIANISRTADRVNSERLGQRIAIEDLPIEFHHLASTFNAMLDRLEASFDRLARFSEDMAHELRTPVGNILGAFQVAVSRPRPMEEYEKLLFLGIEESDRLKRIIESLLFIARSSAPIEASRKQNLDLATELNEIVGFYEALAEESGLVIELIAESQVTAPVERTLLQRAVGNLISNAIRYGPKREKVIVRLSSVNRSHLTHAQAVGTDTSGPVPIGSGSTEVEGSQAVFAKIEVEDRGEGISESEILRVGERFFRTDRSRSKISGGTGLGLSIVKGIMTAHQGHLEIKSVLNQGTCVSLLFPLA